MRQSQIWLEREIGGKVRSLHIDSGKELYAAMKHFATISIGASSSSPYNLSSNGVIERIPGALMGPVRSVLAHTRITSLYWNGALYHGTQEQNAVLHSSTNQQPYRHLCELEPGPVKLLYLLGNTV